MLNRLTLKLVLLAAIMVLAPLVHPSSITLSWTAPGDDENTGTAAEYDARYNIEPIDTLNWEWSMEIFGEPIPLVAGTRQSLTITGLTCGEKYFITIRTRDEAFNWSPLSNEASKEIPFAIPYPNPFNPEFGNHVTFDCVPIGTEILIASGDGSIIKELLSTDNDVTWDGRDQHGNPLEDGIYFYLIPNRGVRGKIELYSSN